MDIPGRDERVFQGLVTPILLGGVDPKLMMLNVGVYLFLVVTFKAWQVIVVGGVVAWVTHKLLQALNRRDPYLRLIYIRYANQADRYEPWPEPQPKRGLRPIGFGRGNL